MTAEQPTPPPAVVVCEPAIVDLPTRGGRGVFVPGNYILTAAHCISCDFSEGMWAISDHLETVRTAADRVFRLSLYAVDLVTDIAVLGEPDDQKHAEDSEAFLEFTDETNPLRLFEGEHELRKDISLVVFNKNRCWVEGAGKIFNATQSNLPYLTKTKVEGGASGGPILTPDGTLLAIVSWAANQDSGRGFDASGCRPLRCLPVRIAEGIREAQAKL